MTMKNKLSSKNTWKSSERFSENDNSHRSTLTKSAAGSAKMFGTTSTGHVVESLMPERISGYVSIL